MVSKLVVGAKANNYQDKEHVQIIESAIDSHLWLHTSLYYPGSLKLIDHIDASRKKKLNCIAKVSVNSRDRGTLRDQVEETLKKSGLEKLNVVQICGNPSTKEMMEGRFFRGEMDALVKEGKVKEYFPEIYWQYSDNFKGMIEDNTFKGCIFYHNIFMREMKTSLYRTINAKRDSFQGVALRALGGGPGNYYEKIVSIEHRQKVLELIKESGLGEYEFRLAYLLSKDFISSLVFGTTKLKNLELALKTVQEKPALDSELVLKLDKIQEEMWRSKGVGNGEGLHRPYGRLGIRLLFKNSKKEIKRLLAGKPKGFDW